MITELTPHINYDICVQSYVVDSNNNKLWSNTSSCINEMTAEDGKSNFYGITKN